MQAALPQSVTTVTPLVWLTNTPGDSSSITRTSSRSWILGPEPPGTEAWYSGSVVTGSIVCRNAVSCGSAAAKSLRAKTWTMIGRNQFVLSNVA